MLHNYLSNYFCSGGASPRYLQSPAASPRYTIGGSSPRYTVGAASPRQGLGEIKFSNQLLNHYLCLNVVVKRNGAVLYYGKRFSSSNFCVIYRFKIKESLIKRDTL